MTYKGYTIAAQEREYNLIEVDEDGRITAASAVIQHNWTDTEFQYYVFKDEDCTCLIAGEFSTVDVAKKAIDRLEVQG